MHDESFSAFRARAERVFARLEAALDELADEGVDIDAMRTGNVLTVTFENGHRLIVNTQEAASELWVAAPSGGFHYRYEDETRGTPGGWRDTRTGDDLAATLARLVALETGASPTFAL